MDIAFRFEELSLLQNYTSLQYLKHYFFLFCFCIEEKKPKVKKPKSEFPVYTVLESSAYMPSYDHGASIEEIEEQMDDWLGNRNRTHKKKASSKS